MAVLLIEMPGGVAGDMLLAALLGLGTDRARCVADLGGLGVGEVGLAVEEVSVAGIRARRVRVDAPQDARWVQGDHGHGHRPWKAIRDLLAAAELPERVRDRAGRVFRLLAEAEGAVHGVDPDEVVFHEVGSLDAIVDVVGCCLCLEQLGVDRVVAGPLRLGRGHVDCAHGRMPVPVPAVVEILAAIGAPQERVDADTGELTTPTGAALVCGLADAWQVPPGRLRAVAYGAGHRNPQGVFNAVRCSLLAPDARGAIAEDLVAEIRCQVDDVPGEALADCCERLREAGARDVTLSALTMKKGRPGHLLTILCDPSQVDDMTEVVLTHSGSIGCRWELVRRRLLARRSGEVTVDGERCRVKIVTLPDGVERCEPEADDVARCARAWGCGFAAARRRCAAAWEGV